MEIVRAYVVLCVFALGIVLPRIEVAAEDSGSLDYALDVLSKSFDSRKGIVSVHAILHARYSQDSGLFSEQEYHFIQDGTKKRFFFDLSQLSEEYCTCFQESQDLLAVLEIDKGLAPFQTTHNPNVRIDIKRSDSLTIDQTGRRLANRREKLVFPQFEYFGYYPGTILNYRHVDFNGFMETLYSYVRRPDSFSHIRNYSVLINNIEHDSMPMIEVQMASLFEGQSKRNTQRFVLDPSKNMFPVFVEQFSPVGQEGGLISTISTTPALHTPSDCWYPAKWIYERHEEGKLTMTESVTVELISLNEPIDTALFTLKGLERLKPDTRVNWLASSPPPATGSLLWNGEEIVSGLPGRSFPDGFLNRPSRLPLMITVNVIVLSLIFLIYFLRRYFQTND